VGGGVGGLALLGGELVVSESRGGGFKDGGAILDLGQELEP
jgi:hypothetical protein